MLMGLLVRLSTAFVRDYKVMPLTFLELKQKQEIKFLGLMKISSGKHILTSSVIKWLNESE